MQFVEFSQIGNCRYLQEIEIIFAGIAKMGDVAIEGGTPVVVLADAAVERAGPANSDSSLSGFSA
ncbi:hypothetical protein ACVIQT_010227 [Bradyrhizobium diazoefficiens]